MNKILIANRGEIALRIMRACREMNIKTVAVYSEADRFSRHTLYADEAYLIGPPPSSQSYLVMDKIIETALTSGAEGIHPGYGFLSENAEFSRKVTEAGLIFIGPTPASIEMMGSKIGAKQAVKKFNVPMVPGTDVAISDIGEAEQIALGIGFPVLIKASAGGGGKGMRVVNVKEEFREQIERARSEAQAAFGDSSVFIEKYVKNPRHIEFQIMADKHGNVIHLFERECSIQRRHQKLVEEAPSCVLTYDLRNRMGEAAVNAARACNYHGAGTIEFLLDDDSNFYFLEMNTRLQVEHPVTEMITGLDLVKMQIQVARGEKLSITQNELKIEGHSIELRVCTEDPCNNFLPETGSLITYKIPQGPGIRVDDAYGEGDEIPIQYDPMIAKLIVYGENRKEAIERMKRAIHDYQISGVATTLPFGTFVMNHEAFITGKFDTGFIEKHFKPEYINNQLDEHEMLAAIAGALTFSEEENIQIAEQVYGNPSTAWKKNRQILR